MLVGEVIDPYRLERESTWLDSNDFETLLECLKFAEPSERKLTWLALACIRRVSHFLTEEPCRQIVNYAERLACDPNDTWDGNYDCWHAANDAIDRLFDSLMVNHALVCAAARNLLGPLNEVAKAPWLCCWVEATWRSGLTSGDWMDLPMQVRNAVSAEHAHLARCVFGNPFRSPPPVDPVWRSWNDNTISGILQRIYDESDFSLLPILADALEEAGCASADILHHCRSGGKHTRGCWVVDLLLDKK